MSGQVSLTAFQPQDAPAIADALSDPTTLRWLPGLPRPYQLAHARTFVAGASGAEAAIRVDGAFAGAIRCDETLGYWVAPRFRRKGIAHRAAIMALSRRFSQGPDRIHANVDPANHASLALLERLGFAGPRPGTIFSAPLKQERAVIRLSLSRAAFVERHGLSIRTERLMMDQVTTEDLGPLYEIATRPEVARMLLRFAPGMAWSDFAAIFTLQAAVMPLRLAIRHEGVVIGSIGIGPAEGNRGHPIFYFLAPTDWGRGYGREALVAFLAEIDARFAPARLHAAVFCDNPASARLLEGVGFRRAGQSDHLSAGRGAPAPAWTFLRD